MKKKLFFRALAATVLINKLTSYSLECPTSLVFLCPLHVCRVLFLLDGSSVKSNDDPTHSSKSFPGSFESWRRSLHSSSCNDKSEEPSRCIAGTSQSFAVQAQFSLVRIDSLDVLRVFAKSRATPEGSRVDLHSKLKTFSLVRYSFYYLFFSHAISLKKCPREYVQLKTDYLFISAFRIYLFDFSIPGKDEELEWSFEQIEFIKDISLGLDFKLHVWCCCDAVFSSGGALRPRPSIASLTRSMISTTDVPLLLIKISNTPTGLTMPE